MVNFIFKICAINLQGLTAPKAAQLRAIQASTSFNVIVLTETHHGRGGLKQYTLLRSVFPTWHLHHVPCPCPGQARLSAHGVAIFADPSVTCTPPTNVHNAALQEDDHRQVAATLTRSGYTCHLVGLHYESGQVGTNSAKGAHKVLQLNATATHFEQFSPFDASEKTIWVAIGDTNISPSDPMYGQFQRRFADIGMQVESYLQLGVTRADGTVTHPPTHVTGNPLHANNMLDFAVVRTPRGIESRVDRLNNPPIQSDHPWYLILTIGAVGNVIPRNRCAMWFRANACIHCGRGNEVNVAHSQCPSTAMLVALISNRVTPRTRARASMHPAAVKSRKYRAGELTGIRGGQTTSNPSARTIRWRAAKAHKLAGGSPRKRGGQPTTTPAKSTLLWRAFMARKKGAPSPSVEEEEEEEEEEEPTLPSHFDQELSSGDENDDSGDGATAVACI